MKWFKGLNKFYKVIVILSLAFMALVIAAMISLALESDEEKAERAERFEQQEMEKEEQKEKDKVEAEKAKVKKEADKKADEEAKESEEVADEEDELSQADEIQQKITELVEDENRIKINKIDVVENFSDDADGGYNALVHLVFDVKNKAKTAKGAINATTDKLGSKLAGTDGLENITFFWEVPYLLEGDNIVKINAEQKNGKMYRVDEWFDGRIFK